MSDYERPPTRGVRSLPDLAASLLSLILSLRKSSSYGELDELRSRIASYLERIDREGRESGIAREDLEAAKYPLVAFIDETILNSEWTHRVEWRERPLQLDLYGETVAGERFFERVEKIRQGGETKLDLLEIYYYCLALGFQGKYGILGGERLRKLTDDIRRELGYATTEPGRQALSPNGRRSSRRIAPEEDSVPVGRIALGVGAGLLILYLILQFAIGLTEGKAVRELDRLGSFASEGTRR